MENDTMVKKNQAGEHKKTSIIETFIKYLTNTSPLVLIFHLIWIVIVSCVLSTSYIIAFHFTSLIAVYNEAHDIKNFDRNLKMSTAKDKKLGIQLEALMTETHSNRAYIYRFHNGLAAVSGVAFFFQTNTNEVISPGTARLQDFEQRIPAGLNMAMNNEFIEDRCGVIPLTTKNPNSQNYWYYERRNAKSVIRCPIFLENGDLLGFIGVDYTADPIDLGQVDAVEEKVKQAAKDAAAIFVGK